MLCVKMFSFWFIGYGDFDFTDPDTCRYAYLPMAIKIHSSTSPIVLTPSIFYLSCLSFVYLCRTHREEEEAAVLAHSQAWICHLWCFEPAGLLYNWFRKVRVGLISSLTQGCCEDVNAEWVNWVVWDESITSYKEQ